MLFLIKDTSFSAETHYKYMSTRKRFPCPWFTWSSTISASLWGFLWDWSDHISLTQPRSWWPWKFTVFRDDESFSPKLTPVYNNYGSGGSEVQVPLKINMRQNVWFMISTSQYLCCFLFINEFFHHIKSMEISLTTYGFHIANLYTNFL